MKLRVGVLRKLSICLMSVGLILPLTVQALGFGGIKLKSALNENLNAEVSLLSASDSDIQSLKVRLATNEAFLRAGIARNAFLQKLDFKVKQYPNGNYYIHVTTDESVREPFLDFLLDLNWKNGRMLREYTMLLDPPGHTSQAKSSPAAETVVAPVIEAPKQAVAEPQVLIPDVIQTPQPTVALVEKTSRAQADRMASAKGGAKQNAAVETNGNDSDEAKPAPFDPQSAFVDDGSDELWPRIPLTPYVGEGDEEAETQTEMGALDYGITKAGDNLWNIAEKLRNGRKDISVYQVMMALLQSNPNAFSNNNVHRLKVGQVLRIDAESALTALSKKEAANAYIKQTNSWNNYRKRVAANAGVQPVVSDTTKQNNASRSQPTTGELTLSSPDGESLVAGGGANEESLSNDFATLKDQLRQTKADAGAMRTQNRALNEKLQQLENELNRMQRSISVKDDELAALQHQLSGLGKEATALVEKETTQEPATKAVDAAVKKESAATVKQEATPPAKAPAAAKEKVQAEQITEVVNTEPGFMDMVTGVAASAAAIVAGIMAGGGLFILAPIALLLLIIVAVIIKRRRQGERFQESILTGATSAEDADNAMTSPSTASEESSFLDDFAISGTSAIETDDSEVDPITEADVFMAYGRYEAAEERLNEAVKNEPDRKDLRVKLLELHHASKNTEAFESSAEEFYANLDGSDEDSALWNKVVALGKEILPASPLFSHQQETEAATVDNGNEEINDVVEMSDSEVMDIGLDTGVFKTADIGESDDDDLDFSLDTVINDDSRFDIDGTDDEIAEQAASAEEAEKNDSDDNSLDFDMDFSSDETNNVATEETTSMDELNLETDDNSLDFDLDMGESTATAPDKSVEQDNELDNDLDFNLDTSSEETAEVSDTKADESESDPLDFELDFGEQDTSAGDALDELDLSDTVELAGESLESELDAVSDETTDSNEMDFDLDLADEVTSDDNDLSLDLELADDTENDTVELADDDLSLDLNLDASDTADDDIMSGDEVGTKLDLAKAYIDMGDPEGARSILSEVLDEGDDKQKEEAQELLGQIV